MISSKSPVRKTTSKAIFDAFTHYAHAAPAGNDHNFARHLLRAAEDRLPDAVSAASAPSAADLLEACGHS
jgi:hypothetical protein